MAALGSDSDGDDPFGQLDDDCFAVELGGDESAAQEKEDRLQRRRRCRNLHDECAEAGAQLSREQGEGEGETAASRAHWCTLALDGAGSDAGADAGDGGGGGGGGGGGSVSLRWRESPDQQARAWECALRLCHYLDRTPRWRERMARGDARVLELGCGLGLPGLSAAMRGAKRVLLTDIKGGVGPASASVVANGMNATVRAEPLQWGDADAARALVATALGGGGGNEGEQHVDVDFDLDVVLCADLIYGDEETASALVETLCAVVQPGSDVTIISLHERRLYGDGGASFISMLEERGFDLAEMALPPLPPPPPARGRAGDGGADGGPLVGGGQHEGGAGGRGGSRSGAVADESEFFALFEITRPA